MKWVYNHNVTQDTFFGGFLFKFFIRKKDKHNKKLQKDNTNEHEMHANST